MKSLHIFFHYALYAIILAAFILSPARPGFAAGQHGTDAADTAGAAKTAAVTLEEIVVTGDKIDDFIKKNPAQTVSMDEKEIEQRNFLQVYDALGSMPGVDVKQGASGLGTRISIRGGGGSGSVLVLIDGRPAGTMQYGGVDLSSIPIDIVQKITVFKPPVPVWLGPGSSAGAVYIETKQKTGKQEKKGKVRVSAGSYGLVSTSATAQTNKARDQFMVSGGLSHKD